MGLSRRELHLTKFTIRHLHSKLIHTNNKAMSLHKTWFIALQPETFVGSAL